VVPVRIEDIQPTKAMAYFVGALHWLDAFTPPLAQPGLFTRHGEKVFCSSMRSGIVTLYLMNRHSVCTQTETLAGPATFAPEKVIGDNHTSDREGLV
jgi:hypothetical protein